MPADRDRFTFRYSGSLRGLPMSIQVNAPSRQVANELVADWRRVNRELSEATGPMTYKDTVEV